jgi:hypothetical protein
MTPEPGASANRDERPSQIRSGDSTSRRVLEDVLKQTAALYALEQASDPADLEPLLEVARKHGQVEFEESVMIDLVRATLRRQLKPSSQSEEQFVAAADRVARTLFENPETHARLKALWVQLLAVEP